MLSLQIRLFAAFSLLPLLFPSLVGAIGMPLTPEPDVPRRGTFFEPIRSVQLAKIQPEKVEHSEVSIPYTRLDVAIVNGIAFQRFLQVYHNHGQENEGFAFELPLNEDTAITGFQIWDRGQRLVGTIEERQQAEAAYQEVTGDEAPDMNKDPGLVRRTAGRFEMRVFPIVPEENKQIELFAHERLGLREGRHFLRIPLRMLAQPEDSRHGPLQSRLTEVSFYIKDALPLKKVDSPHANFVVRKLDEHRQLLTARFEGELPLALDLSFQLDWEGPTSAQALTFSEDGEHFFNARLLAKVPESRVPQQQSEAAGVYLGVWRSRESVFDAKTHDPAELKHEVLALLTLLSLDARSLLSTSWRPPEIQGEQVPAFFRQSWQSSGPQVRKALFETLTQSFSEPAGSMPSPESPRGAVVEHLQGVLEAQQCQRVYLFLDRPEQEEVKELLTQIRNHPEVTFILSTEGDELVEVLQDFPQVSLFSQESGWLLQGNGLEQSRQVLGADTYAELGVLQLAPWAMADWWSHLPDLEPLLPQVRSGGAVQLTDLALFDPRGAHQPEAGERIVLWLSGKFHGSGVLQMEVVNPFGKGEVFWDFQDVLDPKSQVISAPLSLSEGSQTSRFVGSFHARARTQALGARIAALDPGNNRRNWIQMEKEERERELTELRRELVHLSKRFSFISSETAFIALPPDLQEQFSFTPQQYGAEELYNLKGMSQGGLPEPEEWALLLLGGMMLLFFARSQGSLAEQNGSESGSGKAEGVRGDGRVPRCGDKTLFIGRVMRALGGQ